MELKSKQNYLDTHQGKECALICHQCYFNNFSGKRKENMTFCDEKKPLMTCKHDLNAFLTKFKEIFKQKGDFGLFFAQLSQLYDLNDKECLELWRED